MNKILIATASFGDSSSPAVKLLNREGIKFSLNPYQRKLKETEITQLINDCDGVIAGTEVYSEKVLKNAKNLKIISRVGTGIDAIDIKAIKKLNIKLTNTPSAPVTAVSELTLGLILSLTRNIHLSNLNMHSNKWVRGNGKGLEESTVGILGYGRIGKHLAANLVKIGCKKIIVYDLNKKQLKKRKGVDFVSKNYLIKNSDIISIHLPLTKATANMFNYTVFKKMKKNSYLVNTARGEIINEDDLFKSLKNNIIAGAALDVFSNEPYNGDLTKLDNCITTAHLGPMSKLARQNMELEAVQELVSFFNGQKLKNSITG